MSIEVNIAEFNARLRSEVMQISHLHSNRDCCSGEFDLYSSLHTLAVITPVIVAFVLAVVPAVS